MNDDTAAPFSINHELLKLTARICELNSEHYETEVDRSEGPTPLFDEMVSAMKRVLELVPIEINDYDFVDCCRATAERDYYSDSAFDEIDNTSHDFLIAVALHNANTLSPDWTPALSFDRHLSVLNAMKTRWDDEQNRWPFAPRT